MITAHQNFDPDEIDKKANHADKTIRVLNVVFYTLVIACLILGEYYWVKL